MRELSLNVMDIVQNSIVAGADLIEIELNFNPADRTLQIVIGDDGCGMTPEQVEKVQSPFYTTRTTRDIGLGVPFFKMACESTGGSFSIESEVNKGTRVCALFCTDHVDMMPLGDINETVVLLISGNTNIDFVYTRRHADATYKLDTREIKEILDGVPLDSPEIILWLRDFLGENDQALRTETATGHDELETQAMGADILKRLRGLPADAKQENSGES